MEVSLISTASLGASAGKSIAARASANSSATPSAAHKSLSVTRHLTLRFEDLQHGITKGSMGIPVHESSAAAGELKATQSWCVRAMHMNAAMAMHS